MEYEMKKISRKLVIQKAIWVYIVNYLSTYEEKRWLQKVFQIFDSNKDGKISEDELGELQNLADAMENAAESNTPSDLETITELNSRFHMAIIKASGNRRLAEVIGNLAHPLLIQRRFSAFSKSRLQRSMDHHREIIDALAAGDFDWANAIMRSHILASARAEFEAV